jgi:hypothetical protein
VPGKVDTDVQPALAGEVLPRPPTPARRLPLDTVEHVRREACRVYRGMRSGDIPTSEGTKLIYSLSEISKLLVMGKLESRLTALEAAQQLCEG